MVIGAIIKRGYLYNGPRQLGYNLFGENGQARGKIEQAVKIGLVTIRSVFDSIDENGDVAGIKDAPDFQKIFLREIKERFSTFQEFENIVREFLNKENKKAA